MPAPCGTYVAVETAVTAGTQRRVIQSRLVQLTVLSLLVLPLTGGPTASAVPLAALTETQEEARLREAAAAADLAHSGRVVQQAGAELLAVAAELPVAEQAVARAKGEQAGAQAKLTAARAAVVEAERVRKGAQSKVAEAGERVDQGREDVGALARRSYQRGRLGSLQDVMEAGEPQDVLERASLLRSVFRHQDETLERLTRDRRTLARIQADLAAEERGVVRVREEAAKAEARTQPVADEAEAAAERVAALVASRRSALSLAEANRAQDLRDYQAAQEASRALAERIRKAAAAAAAAEARQRAEAARLQAEAEARRQAEDAAARQRAAQAGRPAPPPPPVQRAAPPQAQARAGEMLWPAPGRLTSRYGMRKHPVYGDYRLHTGIDIGGGQGAPIWAAEGGTVILAGPAGGAGNLVVIMHGSRGGKSLATAYAHQSTILVREGQVVTRGQQIGRVGSTGASTGPHLHFEVRVDGDPVDPLGYVSPP